MTALPGIVRGSASRLVRRCVMGVRRGGLVVVVMGSTVARRRKRTVVQPSAPVVSEDCVRLAEREELFPGLWIVAYVRMKLLAQL